MVDQDLPDVVKGDPVRIGQILTNLISNAVKFTPSGKVVITASLNSKLPDYTIVDFEIADTGIGIAPDRIDNIFESFTQASSNTTRKFGGTGLGLTITKKLLELLGSEIKVESEPGKGSVFYFSLKIKNSDTQFVAAVNNSFNFTEKSLKGIKILIADDNEINILLAKQYMKLWDIDCDVAENGLIALKLVETNHYDVVLMDLEMPEMDGYETTRAIRNLPDERFKNLPIIALTASATLDIKDKAFVVGMNDYVSKPFNPDELHRKIASYANQIANVR
jgi:CheY-like chemotaxis protein